MKYLKGFFYSFPVQLVLVSLRRHQLLLAFWILVFSITVGRFAINYGVPYLFFDPEYLDNTGYLAFTLVGMGFGTFYVSWNINCYMLHSYRFHFMARFSRPMGIYFLNNSFVPLIFLINYFIAIIRFQTDNQHYSAFKIIFSLIGFVIGFVIILLFTAVYFTFTNRTALVAEEERRKRKRRWILNPISEDSEHQHNTDRRVESYLAYNLRFRSINTLTQYHPETMRLVYRQHHLNALFAQSAVIVLILCIGFFMDSPLFQIPTAASVFMFLSIIMSLFGVVMYWAGGWATTGIVVFFVVINELYKIDLLGYQSQVYGLDYSRKAAYDLPALKKLASPVRIEHDVAHFTEILEHWRIKNSKNLPAGEKPKLVFINVSGGGLRAARFATAVMQRADSVLDGSLMDRTFMISGASGGMFGATYLRELYLHRINGQPIDIDDYEYVQNISKDLLNPICISILSNDAFVPMKKFDLDSFSYYKDRGYMLEQKLSINTQHILEKRIGDYYQDEYMARIPLLMLHTEITSDARRFFISPQPVSFMMRPVGKYTTNKDLEIDAIDFCRFFEQQHGDRLTMLSALRMNASFPIIQPGSVLPTTPEINILDGGALDNLGSEPTFRIMSTFRDWINRNTSGVVIIQIWDATKHEEKNTGIDKKDFFTMLTNPLGTILNNQMNNQHFQQDQKLGYTNEALDGKVQMISFEYVAEEESKKAALSFHLTQREKDDIRYSLDRPANAKAYQLLEEAIRNAASPEQ